MFGLRKVRRIVAGGATRLASVRAGIAAANPDTTFFAVHDGARPAVPVALIRDCVASARKFGSGVAAAKITDTVKSVTRAGVVESTLDREPLWAAQTPQVFRADLLRKALEKVDDKDPAITDESSAVERLGEKVRIVENPEPNPKITYPGDVGIVARLLGIA
jgi:2-C-methyl-D-erythritol 4-phosphate cytidylyltransferase